MRDYASFGARCSISIPVVPFTSGTASALAMKTTVNAFRRVPFACKVTSAYAAAVTGATAAVSLNHVLCKSTAGTGSATAIGTFANLGTTADGGMGPAATLASESVCTLAAGDLLSVSNAIATTAIVGTWAYDIALEELPS